MFKMDTGKTEPVQTPFNTHMISLFSLYKLTNYNNKFVQIQNDDSKFDIPHNDPQAIENYKKLLGVDELPISILYDSSGHNNYLFQINKTKQPTVNTYFKFNKNSELNFVNNSEFYNDRFSITMALNINGPGIIFKCGDYYKIECHDGKLKFIIGNYDIHTQEIKLNEDILFTWTYVNEMGMSIININNKDIEAKNADDVKFSTEVQDVILGGGFEGIIRSFGVWNWNLLQSQINYVYSKF